jgi:LacI family transcriptional regulator
MEDRSRPPALLTHASIAAVAARAGVSIATVSRVMNGVAKKVSAETSARVREAVAELGYRPMTAGRDLRQRTTSIIPLLVANLANPAMAAIAAGAEAALRADGLVMVVCDTRDDAALQDDYLLKMRAQRPRALVLLGVVPSAQLGAFHAAGEKLVFVSRRSPADPTAPFVGIDNRRAGSEVADHFAERGLRELAAIHGRVTSSATTDRIAGFSERARARGIALDDAAIGTAEGGDHLEIGYRAMDRLLARRPRPSGVFCASDLIAFGAHRRAAEAGLEVPRDIEIVGFDDSPLNDWVAPWLSSVRVPYDRFGPAITTTIRALLDEGRALTTVLPHQLVIRGARAA